MEPGPRVSCSMSRGLCVWGHCTDLCTIKTVGYAWEDQKEHFSGSMCGVWCGESGDAGAGGDHPAARPDCRSRPRRRPGPGPAATIRLRGGDGEASTMISDGDINDTSIGCRGGDGGRGVDPRRVCGLSSLVPLPPSALRCAVRFANHQQALNPQSKSLINLEKLSQKKQP